MEHSPFSSANPFSASQETVRILWKARVHYRIYRSPPHVPIQSQFNPVYTPILLSEDLFLYRVIHKSVKHFKNSQQIDYATDHGNSYVDGGRKC